LKEDFPRLAQFLERHQEDSRWFAPQEALSNEGALLPLTQRYESICVKNLSLKETALKSINRELKEALAWRWLIISHNAVVKDPSARVKLPPKLSLSYERKRASAPPVTDFVPQLREIVEGLVKATNSSPKPPSEAYVKASNADAFISVVVTALKWQSSTYATFDSKECRFNLKPGQTQFQSTIERWNTVLSAADTLMSGAEVVIPEMQGQGPDLTVLFDRIEEEAESQELDHDALARECEEMPESFDKDGLQYFRADVDLLDIYEGQTFVSTVFNGVEYRAVVGTPVGPAKSKKAKGKTAVKAAPSPKGEGSKSPTAEGPKKVTPLATENPLRVKGEPKTKALSDGQRKALRQFFKLKEGLVPAAEWATMSNRERAAAMAERSIPRWATESVLRSAGNLQLILEGKLTKENANSAARTPKAARTVMSSQALEAWQQLKSDFKGTPLLRQPVTGKEKAFKKRFDQLVADYGQQSFFPKLRDRPDQQGRRSSASGGTSRTGAGDLLDMVRAMGEIAKAFRGV